LKMSGMPRVYVQNIFSVLFITVKNSFMIAIVLNTQ
jgi:hypothetical protein